MEDGSTTPSSFSISSLMCQEDSRDLDFSIESEISHRKNSLSFLKDEGFSETEDKYIERLVSKEISFCTMYRPACSSSCYEDYSSVVSDDWFKSVRFNAVQWILRVSPLICRMVSLKKRNNKKWLSSSYYIIIIKCLNKNVISLYSPLFSLDYQTSIYFGMGFQTSYLAVTYFDRFSLRRIIDVRNIYSSN